MWMLELRLNWPRWLFKDHHRHLGQLTAQGRGWRLQVARNRKLFASWLSTWLEKKKFENYSEQFSPLLSISLCSPVLAHTNRTLQTQNCSPYSSIYSWLVSFSPANIALRLCSSYWIYWISLLPVCSCFRLDPFKRDDCRVSSEDISWDRWMKYWS